LNTGAVAKEDIAVAPTGVRPFIIITIIIIIIIIIC